ncbi:hypothetical protein SRRS_46640 [Sporomusa rhizae]
MSPNSPNPNSVDKKELLRQFVEKLPIDKLDKNQVFLIVIAGGLIAVNIFCGNYWRSDNPYKFCVIDIITLWVLILSFIILVSNIMRKKD